MLVQGRVRQLSREYIESCQGNHNEAISRQNPFSRDYDGKFLVISIIFRQNKRLWLKGANHLNWYERILQTLGYKFSNSKKSTCVAKPGLSSKNFKLNLEQIDIDGSFHDYELDSFTIIYSLPILLENMIICCVIVVNF